MKVGRAAPSIGEEDLRALVMHLRIAHGAAGFVPKSASGATLVEALRTVLSGRAWVPPRIASVLAQRNGSGIGARASTLALDLSEAQAATLVSSLTPQQFRVLVMLCSGLQNKQIGLQLNVTEATVKAHMRAIMDKFGASNRTQVVLMARHLALDQAAATAERKSQTRFRVPDSNAR